MGWREGAGLRPAPRFKGLSLPFIATPGRTHRAFQQLPPPFRPEQGAASASGAPHRVTACYSETDESFSLQGPRTVPWAGRRSLQREPCAPRALPKEDSKQAVCLDKALLKTLQKFMYKTTFPPPYQDVSHPPGTKQVPGACCQLGGTQRVLGILQKYQIHVV